MVCTCLSYVLCASVAWHVYTVMNITRMHLKNLAIVFGPNLMRNDNPGGNVDPHDALRDMASINAFALCVLEHAGHRLSLQ